MVRLSWANLWRNSVCPTLRPTSSSSSTRRTSKTTSEGRPGNTKRGNVTSISETDSYILNELRSHQYLHFSPQTFCKDAVVAQRCVFPHYLVLLFFHIYRLNDWFLNFSSYFLYSRLALSICWTQSGLLGGKKKGNKPSVHFHLLCIRRKLLPAFINIVHVNFIDKKVSLYYFFTFIVQLYCSLFELRCYSCVNRFGR